MPIINLLYKTSYLLIIEIIYYSEGWINQIIIKLIKMLGIASQKLLLPIYKTLQRF